MIKHEIEDANREYAIKNQNKTPVKPAKVNVQLLLKKEDNALDLFIEMLKRNNSFAVRIESSKLSTNLNFCRMLLQERFTDNSLKRGVLNAFVVENNNKMPEALKEFIRPSDFTVVLSAHKLIEKFINEKCLEKDNELIEIADEAQIFPRLAEFVCMQMKEIFGNKVFLDADKIKNEAFKAHILKTMSNLEFNRCGSFFVCPESSKVIKKKEEFQALLLSKYIQIVEEELKNFSIASHYTLNEKILTQRFNLAEEFLTSIESLMLDQTKKSPQFLKAKQGVEYFFKNEKDALLQEAAINNFCSNLRNGIQNFGKGKATKKELEALQEFAQRIQLTNQALEIKDKDGKPYPCNYFVFMPISFFRIRTLLNSFISCGFLKNKQLLPAKQLLQKLMPGTGMFAQSQMKYIIGVSLEHVLESDYMLKRVKSNGQVIDFSTPEKLQVLKTKVLETVEKYNMPKISPCFNLVASEFARGRECAVQLGELENEVSRTK